MAQEQGLVTTIVITEGCTGAGNKNTVALAAGSTRDAIDWIRSNSHRYLGKYVNGEMHLCQLNDADGTKYADGSDATTDQKTVGIDSWMKLPDFWYKCDTYGMNVNAADDSSITEDKTGTNTIVISFSTKKKGGFQKWDGNSLFGVYESYATGGKAYSVSGVGSTESVSQSNWKTYARSRNASGKVGFRIVTWEQHCIMAALYYAYYLNVDCQTQCGSGTNSYQKQTGGRDSLGMVDTTSANGNSGSINFWGLENWWGNKYEWIDNIRFNVSGVDYIYHVDNISGQQIRQFKSFGSTSATGNCCKMYWGNNLDLAQAAVSDGNSSYNSGYCDFLRSYSDQSARVAGRSSNYSNADGGVGYSGVYDGASNAYASYGSRLAFEGTAGGGLKIESVSDFKSL